MVALDIRRGQLGRLIDTLGDVVAIVRMDRQCEWTVQFEQFLQAGQQLAATGFTQAQLDDFSRTICRIFDSHRAFADYQPPANLSAEGLHGARNFETFKRATYERALQLRVIE